MHLEYIQIEKTSERFPPQSERSNGGNQFKKMLEIHQPKPLRRGQIIEGEILRLADNVAILDVGAKRDAIVPPDEMGEVGESFLDQLAVGDTVPVYIMRTPVGDEELLVSLEKGQREKDWERAAELLEDEEMLELKVVGKNKGGLLVEFGRLRGFVPNSHLPALATIYDRQEQMNQKAKMINSELPVKVLEIDRQRKRLVLSAKEAQEELQDARLAELKVGQVVSGCVVNLVPYGAFVDLGGVTGLLHVSELAWHKVDDPADVLDLGQEIEVMVKKVEPDKGRVALSRKELLPNPWEQFAQRYEIGDLLTGEVTALVDFGAFVRLPLEVEGLIHISKMGLLPDIKPEELLSPGDQVIVRLLNIEPDRERIGLSLHEGPIAEENIWPYSQEEDQPLLDVET